MSLIPIWVSPLQLELTFEIQYVISMPTKLTELPKGLYTGLIGFPFCKNLEDLMAEITILGIPYGLPHYSNQFANDQSLAPDLLKKMLKIGLGMSPRL